MNTIFSRILIIILSAGFLVSCDKDYNTVGADVFGDQNFEFDVYNVQNIKTFSKATGPVQSNNLPINSLGILNNPYFGKTTATLVSQIELATPGVNIGFNAVIDSVYLYIPYFVDGSQTATDANGNKTYVLDSVYNYNENAKFKLEVFENNYFLNDFDPTTNFQDNQKYFSDQKADVDAVKGVQLNNGDVSQNNQFTFSNKEKKIFKTNSSGFYVGEDNIQLTDQLDESIRVVIDRKAPGMWLDLDKVYFQQKILDQPDATFVNNNVFKNYFKGLYFNVEEIVAGQGSLAMLDLAKAELKIKYKSAVVNAGDLVSKEINFQMGSTAGAKKSNTINFFDYANNATYNAAITAASNEVTGAEKIILKGGQGSIAYLKLFGDADANSNLIPDELDALIANEWLINQAELTFHIDRPSMAGVDKSLEPQRIYIYDATNNKPIADYFADPSTTSNFKNNKGGFNGIIKKDANGKGVTYTFQVYQYIYNLLKSTNPALNKDILIGIAVTENINVSQNAFLKNPLTVVGKTSKFLPVASVMNPLGTVLYGKGPGVTADNEIKLKIYYTKPNL